jgi:hypothetical protein
MPPRQPDPDDVRLLVELKRALEAADDLEGKVGVLTYALERLLVRYGYYDRCVNPEVDLSTVAMKERAAAALEESTAASSMLCFSQQQTVLPKDPPPPYPGPPKSPPPPYYL